MRHMGRVEIVCIQLRLLSFNLTGPGLDSVIAPVGHHNGTAGRIYRVISSVTQYQTSMLHQFYFCEFPRMDIPLYCKGYTKDHGYTRNDAILVNKVKLSAQVVSMPPLIFYRLQLGYSHANTFVSNIKFCFEFTYICFKFTIHNTEASYSRTDTIT